MAALRAAVFSAIREKPEGWAFFAPPPPPPVRMLMTYDVTVTSNKVTAYRITVTWRLP